MRKRDLAVSLFAAAVLLGMLTGCASQPAIRSDSTYQGIAGRTEMGEAESSQAMVYRNPDVNLFDYTKIILLPVEVYSGKDAVFSGATGMQIKEMADFLQAEVTRTLQSRRVLVNEPGPGALRARFILAGMGKTVPALQVMSFMTPAGLAMNLGNGALGRSGNAMGSVTIAGEFYDSKTGLLVSSFIGRFAPNALALGSAFGTWDAARYGITDFAKKLGEGMDQTLARQKS